MSGLLAGMMLARRGWEVDIFERVAGELAGRGAGIVAQPELIARLTALASTCAISASPSRRGKSLMPRAAWSLHGHVRRC